jgi:hypothetical protein
VHWPHPDAEEHGDAWGRSQQRDGLDVLEASIYAVGARISIETCGGGTMKLVATLVGVTVYALFGVISCGWYPYVGHPYADVASAIKEGRVRSAMVDVDHDTGKSTAMFLDLADGEKWALSGSDSITASLKLIESYNATAPKSSRISVNKEASYGASTPTSRRASPTTRPRSL